MLTLKRSLLIAQAPQYYHSDNLTEAAAMLMNHPDLAKKIRMELMHRRLIRMKEKPDRSAA